MKNINLYLLPLLFIFFTACKKDYEVVNVNEVEPIDSIITPLVSKYPITLYIINNDIQVSENNGPFNPIGFYRAPSKDSIIFFSKDSVQYNACRVPTNTDGDYTFYRGPLDWTATDNIATGYAWGGSLIISRDDNSIIYSKRYTDYTSNHTPTREIKIEGEILELDKID